jgi:type II secretory pathway pseudopilin PulG
MSAGKPRERGFTYIGFMMAIAVMGAGLVAYGELASHSAQREKEVELLFRGEQYRAAIASYYKKEQRYPQTLADLLEDKRYPMPVRHLRKLYRDPVTGEEQWAVVEAPGGGIMGVHSKSEEAPIKVGNFSLANQEFVDKERYADWKFIHSPPGLPAGVDKSPAK